MFQLVCCKNWRMRKDRCNYRGAGGKVVRRRWLREDDKVKSSYIFYFSISKSTLILKNLTVGRFLTSLTPVFFEISLSLFSISSIDSSMNEIGRAHV